MEVKRALGIALLALPALAHANFADFFGASASTSSIGGQANLDRRDPTNIYYAPALMAWSQKIGFAFDYSTVHHDFEDINNVVIKNSTNSTPGTTTYGNIPTDYPDYRNVAISANLPIRYDGAGNLGLAYFGPMGNVMEVNTGHPTRPEYVLYHARYRRSMIYLSYAHPLTEELAFSIGTLVGFQTGADAGMQASLTGTGYGSSASTQAKISPSLGAHLSLAMKASVGQIYFAYSQEMKQHLKANVNGEMNDPPVAFDASIDSMIYYDPHTFRVGGALDAGPFQLMGSLEYQIWSGYQTPVVRITRRSTIMSTDNYERVNTRNTLVPRIGVRLAPVDYFAMNAGVSYRPTPLQGDFSGSGNSVDTNTLTFSAGPEFRMRFLEKDWKLSAALIYQKLDEKTVTKSTRQENGNAGDKIGAPGYKIGGSVLAATLGLSLSI